MRVTTFGSLGIANPLRWIGRYLEAAEQARKRRLSARRLSVLGDHELADIGLSREDAEMLARDPDTLPRRLWRG